MQSMSNLKAFSPRTLSDLRFTRTRLFILSTVFIVYRSWYQDHVLGLVSVVEIAKVFRFASVSEAGAEFAIVISVVTVTGRGWMEPSEAVPVVRHEDLSS